MFSTSSVVSFFLLLSISLESEWVALRSAGKVV